MVPNERRRKLAPGDIARAVAIAAVVGTLLLLLNHGDHLSKEPVCAHFYAKALGCYVVPFVVSLASVMLVGCRRWTA